MLKIRFSNYLLNQKRLHFKKFHKVITFYKQTNTSWNGPKMYELFHQSLLLLFCSYAAVTCCNERQQQKKPIGLSSKENHLQNENDTLQIDIKILPGDSRFSKGPKGCWRIALTDG